MAAAAAEQGNGPLVDYPHAFVHSRLGSKEGVTFMQSVPHFV